MVPVRSSWNETRLLMRGPLTDRKIAKYEKAGWYSPEFREARREMLERKRARQMERESRREGNFLVFQDGRKVYSPE